MKAQSIYEYIVSFAVFLVMALFLFQLMLSLGPESIAIFEKNTACLQANQILEYSTESRNTEKINLNFGINKINYSKWESMSETDYIAFKNSNEIFFPFKLQYTIKELPLNKTDTDTEYPNGTAAKIIRMSGNQIKVYANGSAKATLKLIINTFNKSSSVNIIESGCNSGTLEAEDSASAETGKMSITMNLNKTDYDCLIFSVDSNEEYLYFETLEFSDLKGEKMFPVFLENTFRLNGNYGSQNIEKKKQCSKGKYVIIQSTENEKFIAYIEAKSWN